MHIGHIKINEIFKTKNNVNPFGDNSAMSFIYEKAERLVMATYALTKHINDKETIRIHIRDISGKLLTDILNIQNDLSDAEKVIARIRLIMSWLDVAHVSGFVSWNNLSILKNAYKNFARHLMSVMKGDLYDSVTLNDSDFGFDISEHLHILSKRKEHNKGNGNLQSSRSDSYTDKHELKNDNECDLQEKNSANNRIMAFRNKGVALRKGDDRSLYKNESGIRSAKNGRVALILEFISQKGGASIGELSEIITDCSSKTLQRDVNDLIRNGVLKKTGSKRWTRYFLVDSVG